MADGELIHAEIRIGDSVVMISEDDIEPAGVIMATYWDAVDAVWQRALAAGAVSPEEIERRAAEQFGSTG